MGREYFLMKIFNKPMQRECNFVGQTYFSKIPYPPPPKNQLVHPLVVILVKILVHILLKCVQHRLSSFFV